MLKKFNNKGFTLIELMIVIAIIGILAAIAIPNFISYRNKSFCSTAESDANSIAGAIADYFAIPTHTAIVNADLQAGGAKPVTISAGNTFTVSAAAPNTAITITVGDASNRCPNDYQSASTFLPDGVTRSWVNGVYTKVITQ